LPRAAYECTRTDGLAQSGAYSGQRFWQRLATAQLLPGWLYAGVTFLMFVAGIFICGRAARDWSVSDHPAIVWDEIVGLLVTMSLAPVGAVWLLAGFVLFRLFDIAKPWPICSVDRRVHGGLGIMLDDVVAGMIAGAILYLGVRWLS